MDLAVIRTSGKQFLVKSGQTIEVNGHLGKVGDKIIFDEILLSVSGEDVRVGTPVLSGVKVSGEIVFVGKGEKIDVMKFKAKSRYRRKMGFRALITRIKISLNAEEDEAPSTLRPGYLLPALRRERNPSEAKISSLSSASSRSGYFAKGDKKAEIKNDDKATPQKKTIKKVVKKATKT